MARILAVDFGEKRIGLAISDESKKIAFRYKTIENNSFQKVVAEFQEIVKKENIEKIVFGLPLTLKSTDSETTKKARDFFEKLKKAVSVEIVLSDERFSSGMAKKMLSFQKTTKEIIDQEAARIILEDYLRNSSD